MKNLLYKVGLVPVILLLFLFIPICIDAQNIKVTGTVTSPNGEPLTAVIVSEKGTKNSTITGLDGTYSISVSSKSLLEVSYLGFKSLTVPVNGKSNIDVILQEDVQSLDEFVVIGYGAVKKSDLTGAVSSLKADALSNTPTAGIESALQGKISGVFVTNKSGQPGTTADIKIRGIGSFNSSGPLWVIDGVQQSPGVNFNMNDAESIEVLKDASAAAIYGAAAANGVIIVTTKHAKEGETKVNFNAYWGWTNPTNMIKPLSSAQLKRLRIEDLNGQGGMTEDEMLAYPLLDSQKGYALDFAPTNVDYNWKDVLFGTGVTQNYDVSVSKGTEKHSLFSSFNYYTEKGTYVDTGFKRVSFRLNTDDKLFNWLTVGEKLLFTFTKTNPYADSRYLNNFMRVLPFMMPYDSTNQPGGFGYFPKYDEEGNAIDVKSMLAGYDGGNPLCDELSKNINQKNWNLNGTVYAKIQPIKQFDITATFSGGIGSGYSHIENYEFWYHQLKKQDYSYMEEKLGTSYGWTTNIVAHYQQKFGEHSLAAMAGFEASYGWGRQLNASAKNMLGGLYILGLASKADRDVSAGYSNNATASYFGRINYSYKDRYLFTAVMRYDGSDRFSPKHRWGTFPSFSAAWRISDEPFMKKIHWIDQLKLRASWGILGNSGISQFLYTSNYNTYTANYAYGLGPEQTAVTGVVLDHMPNTEIKWEEIKTTDIGLDLGLFGYRLTLTADWYVKNTTDALFNSSLPDMSGFGIKTNATPSYLINVGKIRNTGLDLEANWRDNFTKDFSYQLGGNISFFKNKVISTNENNDILISGSVLSGTNISYTMPGKPMSTFFGYKVEGVFQNQEQVDKLNSIAQAHGFNYYQESGTAAGDLLYKDVNGDGHINSDDITELGNPWPDFTYGITLGLNWKMLDFSVSIQGVSGGDIFYEYKSKTHTLYLDYNTTTYALNRWTKEGSTNENFRMNVSDPNGNESKPSDWFMESASYLRLKNIQLGFTFPKVWMSKVGINKLRVYIGAQNLFTITNYEGFDPEFSTGANTAAGIDRGFYPQNRTIQCGVQVEL